MVRIDIWVWTVARDPEVAAASCRGSSPGPMAMTRGGYEQSKDAGRMVTRRAGERGGWGVKMRTRRLTVVVVCGLTRTALVGGQVEACSLALESGARMTKAGGERWALA